MVSIDLKAEAKASTSTLNTTSSKEDTTTLSFANLLQGASTKKDEKGIQNGAFVLALASQTPKEKLQTLAVVMPASNKNILKIHKGEVALAVSDLKVKTNVAHMVGKELVVDTKEYYKTHIKHQVEDEKNVSENLLSKEEVIVKTDSLASLLKNKSTTIIPKESAVTLNPQLTETLTTSDIKALIYDAKNYLKAKILLSSEFKKSEVDNLPKTLKGLVQVAQKFGVDVSKITLEEVKPQAKELPVDVKTKKVHPAFAKIETTETPEVDDLELQRQLKVDDKKIVKEQELKSTPLFKAVANKEHTTEQIVLTKLAHVESKEPTKKKADETLQKLLSGDKVLKQDSTLTADFSVASAKVSAPRTVHESSRSLESLLKGDSSTNTEDIVKPEMATASKTDSFEVKINEAKQLTKYLSQDVKQAIEDYKSPFTRVKLQLNPQRLGEVDLTIVQRGKNLHINLSSNNAAINALALNANDLKVQLNNNGINNATLNFNNNSQSDQSGANQQHQQRHNEQKAQDEYSYFENQEANEEVLSSLEIVVPRYI